MSYLLENDTTHIIEDILKRKEFYQYDLPKTEITDIIPRFMLNKMISDGNYLQFHSYQLFVANYINPNTPYSRLLMKWQTGTGKTIGALSLALNFIKYFQKEESQGVETTGSVFIIGFTSHIFKNELLRFPEFGIISRQELLKLSQLKKMAYSGNKFDIENLQEFLTHIKKRFSNRKNNGFFKFIGYKKLVNMIFKIMDPALNLTAMNSDDITKAIDDGKIQINNELLDEFKNSLIICDEIHNVYNTLTTNNWGIALQYILNYHPSIRAVFMSATPINNSPMEIVDLLNLLLPQTHYKKLLKSDFFESDKKLKRGALDTLADLCKGRVSYLRDVNPKYFPTKTFIGENIQNMPYLKFIRCPMSPFHYNTYKSVYTGSLSPESQYLTDFAIPNPNDDKIGLYQTSEIKKLLPYASQAWKDANKINYHKDRIVGDILQLKNLHKISTKYVKMLEVILDNIRNQNGKMFIYHNVIHMSGVLFIQEILLQNYIIGEFDSSTDNTLCVACGKMRKEHTSQQLNVSGGSNENSNDDIRFNTETNSYEVFDKRILMVEYKKCDNIILIQSHSINYDLIDKVKEFITNQPTTNTIIIQSPNIITDALQQLFTELGYIIIHVNSKSDTAYPSMLYYSQKDNLESKYVPNMISNIEKRLCNIKSINGGRSKRGKSNNSKNQQDNNEHTYTPVRFITAHSELDRARMYASLEKFNSPDNSNGSRILILIGGKLMQESHDIKAVREMMIMGKPDNIPILIQILGRAIRKNSHKYLPETQRNVNIRIFTSCEPNKDAKTKQYKLGYEEEKYADKLDHYKIIQNIEKTLHENAIDSFINRDIIWSPEEQKKHRSHKNNYDSAELGALYFEPNLPNKLISNGKNKTFKLNELNLQTFDAFNTNEEIDNITIIIKRLFIERSPIWTYEDLLAATKQSREFMDVEFNTQLISEDLFIVALSRLVWAMDDNYVEPIINNIPKQQSTNSRLSVNMNGVENIIDKLYDTDDKIIILPGNQKSVITQLGLYYILFPIDTINNEPLKILELPYRINKSKEDASINIQNFLESGQSLVDYADKRTRFFNKWNNVPIEKLEMAVCDFGTDFHTNFLEECVTYVFEVWTDPKLKKSTMHAFYFKMLNYYDLRQLVIWGHTLKPYIFKTYKDILLPVSIKLDNRIIADATKVASNSQTPSDMGTSGLINLLKSSINKSDLNWISSGLKQQFEINLSDSLKLFDGNYKKTRKMNKIKADLVPVGHFLKHIPKFYHPTTGWVEEPEYLTPGEVFVENTTIVGYDERSKTGVHIRFKIRNPIQNIKQFKDSRLIEKGSVCSSKNKIYLKAIAKTLGVKLRDKLNVTTLCNDIRTRLIYLELKERLAKTNKKYFYFIYEQRPETVIEHIN